MRLKLRAFLRSVLLLVAASSGAILAQDTETAAAHTIRFSSERFLADAAGKVRIEFEVSPALEVPIQLTLSTSNAMHQGTAVLIAPVGQRVLSRTLSLPDLEWPLTLRFINLPVEMISEGAPAAAEILPASWSPELTLLQVTPEGVTEGYPAFFRIDRFGAGDRPLELAYSTRDVTARAGVDYLATNGVVRFGAGESSTRLSVETLRDGESEGPEEFALVFDHLPDNVRATGAMTATLSESPLGWNFYWTDGFEGGGDASISIYTDNAGISLSYSTEEGTAKPGVDYVPVTGSFTNAVSPQIQIPILDDSRVEAPESFVLNLVETFPNRTTNRIEILILDNEIPVNRDPSFQPADIYEYVSMGAVLKDERIALLAWPNTLTVLGANGKMEQLVPLGGRVQPELEFPLCITPLGELLLGSGWWPGPVLGEPSLKRVKPDGTADATFHPELPAGAATAALGTASGQIYVAINEVGLPDWRVLRLNHDGSRDQTFPILRKPGWGERVIRLGLAGADTIEILSSTCYYRHCDSYRLVYREGVLLRAESEGSSYSAKPLTEQYAGESGDRICTANNGQVLYRRKPDGTIDPTLRTGTFDGYLTYIGTQANGNIIAYDNATMPAGKLVRLGPGTVLNTNLVQIANPTFYGTENGNPVEVELIRGGDSSNTISVWGRTAEGSAQAGDYEPIDTEIVFAPYEVVKRVPVRALQDALIEGSEQFYFGIGAPAIGTMVEESRATLNLIDDDYLVLQTTTAWDGGFYIYADNPTGRRIELQASNDGGRTWRKIRDPESYLSVTIPLNGKYRMFRGVFRD